MNSIIQAITTVLIISTSSSGSDFSVSNFETDYDFESCTFANSLSISLVGNWPFGPSHSVQSDLQRNLVFCGSGGGVFIYDVSNPDTPVKVSEQIHTLGASVIDMYYDEVSQLLYIAAEYEKLEIWDVQNPENPIKLGSCEVPGDVRRVTVSGDYAYVLSIHMRIIDVSDPSNPFEAGFFIMDNEYNKDVAVFGDYAYLTDSPHVLRVVDVSDPSNPEEVLTINSVYYSDIEVFEQYLIACNTNGYLCVYDLSTPAAPTELSITDLGYGGLESIDIIGNQAIVSDAYTGLLVVDVSSVLNPVVTGVFPVDDDIDDVSLVGTQAFLAADNDGFISVDISDASSPVENWTIFPPHVTWRVSVEDDLAYLANGHGIYIVDVSNPSFPYEVGCWESSFWMTRLAVSGNYVYAAEVGGGAPVLRVIDASQADNPIEVGNYNPSESINGITLYNGYVFIAEGSSGVEVIDISNPANPTKINLFTVGAPANEFVMNDDTLYISTDSGLYIYDVSNVLNPVPLGSYELSDFGSMVYSDGYLFVTTGYNGMKVLDVSDPFSITQVAACSVGWYASRISQSDDNLYISDQNSGALYVIDISSPVNPYLADEYGTPGYAYDVFCYEGMAFVADYLTGLQIYEYSENGLEEESGNAGDNLVYALSNPSDSSPQICFTILENSDLRISVFDLSGRQIQTIEDKYFVEGFYQYELDDLPTGSYIVVLDTNYGTYSGKFVVIQ